MNTKHTLLLLLRLAAGGMLAYAGIMKLFNIEMTSTYFESMGIIYPVIVWVVAIGETVAGLSIVFGVYTQSMSTLATIIMAGAVYYSNLYASPKEVMAAAVLLVGTCVLMYAGSGTFAILPSKQSITN